MNKRWQGEKITAEHIRKAAKVWTKDPGAMSVKNVAVMHLSRSKTRASHILKSIMLSPCLAAGRIHLRT